MRSAPDYLFDISPATTPRLVGTSRAIAELVRLIECVAPSPAPVLIRGESGTGKELVARAIHDASPRRSRPFVAINCTAMPEALVESELFGHARGAFTGAVGGRDGLFAEASGGTLFLDELGDMPATLQAKLLRVLQDGEVRAVGADRGYRVDVRVIAATNRDLEERIRTGQFRADLFYRLDVIPIVVPPLRARPEDLPALVAHFFDRARMRNPHATVERLAPDVVPLLARYAWPGNVRELENLIERLTVFGGSRELSAADIARSVPYLIGDPEIERYEPPRERRATLREVEAEYVAWVLERCAHNKTKAAQQLGIDPSTLHRWLRQKA